jgi:hypothetical protein
VKLIGGGNSLVQVGQAMINAVERGYDKTAIEVRDISKLSKK